MGQKWVIWAPQKVRIGSFGSEKGPLTPRKGPTAPKNPKIKVFGRSCDPHFPDFPKVYSPHAWWA